MFVGSGLWTSCFSTIKSSWAFVTVFERENKIGGLLRYEFQILKWKNVIDRRLKILKSEGIEFKRNVEVGKTISAKELERQFDAVI